MTLDGGNTSPILGMYGERERDWMERMGRGSRGRGRGNNCSEPSQTAVIVVTF